MQVAKLSSLLYACKVRYFSCKSWEKDDGKKD